MTHEQLRTYILADETLAAMANAGNDNGIAEALNGQTIENGLYISRDVLEVFAIGQGIAAIAKITAETSGVPSSLKVACLSLGQVLASSHFPQLRLDDAATEAMRAGLVAGSVMTQAQDDALEALGVRHYLTPAEVEWGDGAVVSIDDVSACLLGHRTVWGE